MYFNEIHLEQLKLIFQNLVFVIFDTLQIRIFTSKCCGLSFTDRIEILVGRITYERIAQSESYALFSVDE